MLTLFWRDRKYLLKNLNMVLFIYAVFKSLTKTNGKLFYICKILTRKNDPEIIKNNNHIIFTTLLKTNPFYCYFGYGYKVNLFVIMSMIYLDKSSIELKKGVFSIDEVHDKN